MCVFLERIKRMVTQFIRFVKLLYGGTKLSAEDGFSVYDRETCKQCTCRDC